MGSGAFINEMLNQLADAYLARKQQELGQRLPPDAYRDERQKVKAWLASHNVYGVDLNPTAVELAGVSIWLNTIYRDAPAPWYGARLAVGNSLIGARSQVYAAEAVQSGAYAATAPAAAPVGQPRPPGSIYHFLLPDKGMAAFDNDKVIRELAPAAVAQIKAWRKEFTRKFTAEEIRNLQALSDRVETLWAQHTRQRRALLARTHDPIAVWGQAAQGRETPRTIAQKDADLAELQAPSSAYRRLKLVMDYWCALWFWPIPDAGKLPSRSQFLSDLESILQSEERGFAALAEQLALYSVDEPALAEAQPALPGFGGPVVSDVDALAGENERLAIVVRVAQAQRFHHWELAFAEVFAERGGFDLMAGNPPWVKMSFDETGVLSEYDPRLVIRNVSASDVARQREEHLDQPARVAAYGDAFVEMNGSLAFLNAGQNYPLLKGMQTNLYKCFITRAWEIGAPSGVVSFLHPEGVYDDPKGGELRAELYPRLRSHFQFHNELVLFAEVDHHTKYSVNVYRSQPQPQVDFDHVVNLFHPATIDSCYAHDGHSAVPGIKDEADRWETRGHRSRIVRIDEARLRLFAGLYDEAGTPSRQARLPAVHSEEIVAVLERFAAQPQRLGRFGRALFRHEFWHETDVARGWHDSA